MYDLFLKGAYEDFLKKGTSKSKHYSATISFDLIIPFKASSVFEIKLYLAQSDKLCIYFAALSICTPH